MVSKTTEEESSFFAVVIRLIVFGALLVLLLLMMMRGDYDRQIQEQADVLDRDDEGRIRTLLVNSERFDPGLLPQLDGLRKLTIADRLIDPDLARHIAKSNVRSLTLRQCQISPEAAAILATELSGITELSLAGSERIGGELELPDLLKIPCRLLDLSGCMWITDEHVVLIAGRQPQLESLKLGGTAISEQALTSLAPLKNLIELDLSNCQIQGPDLPAAFAAISSLRSLHVCGSLIPLQQLRSISDAKPELQLYFIPSLYPDLAAVRPRIAMNAESDDGVRLFGTVFDSVVIDDATNLQFDSLRWLPELRHIRFVGADVTDDRVAFVEQMPQLKSLRLAGTSITDVTLERVSRLDSLTYLDISGTPVTDDGIAGLRRCDSLQELNLADTALADSGLRELTKSVRLSHLDLSSTRITAAGLEWLVNLPDPPEVEWSDLELAGISESLTKRLQFLTNTLEVSATAELQEFLRADLDFEYLRIKRQTLTDAHLKTLATWPRLMSVKLEHCRFEHGPQKLSALQQLRHLKLANCGLSDASVESMLLPPNLNSLDLSGNPVRGFELKHWQPNKLHSIVLSETRVSLPAIRRLLSFEPNYLDVRDVDFRDADTQISSIPKDLRVSDLTLSLNEPSIDAMSRIGLLQLASVLNVHVDDSELITQEFVEKLLCGPQLVSVDIHGSQQACDKLTQLMRAIGFGGSCNCRVD